MAACVQEILYIDCGFGADPYPNPIQLALIQKLSSAERNFK